MDGFFFTKSSCVSWLLFSCIKWVDYVMCDKPAISATARMKKKPWDLASYSFHFLYEPHFSLDTGQKDLKKKKK